MILEVSSDGVWTIFMGALTFFMVMALGSCVKWPLGYGAEAHRSSIIAEWSNMIGYKMSSTLVGAHTTTKTSPVKNFKHG